MIERFSSCFDEKPEILSLRDLGMKGGCLGCIQCGYDNVCAYDDGFAEFYNRKLKGTDILVFAGAIKDRYLSSLWKMYFDRTFFNNHAPTLQGRQLGFIVSGPLSRVENLREVLRAFAEWQQMNLVDFVSDEFGSSSEIDDMLQGLAKRLARYSEKNYVRPPTFLGVSSMKLFRDAIWGKHRVVFQADHRNFSKNGVYDFPYKDVKTVLFNAFVMLMCKLPAFRKKFYKKLIKPKMIEPHRKLLKKLFSD
jgi:multimeric flavodoxin WrbA